MKIRCWDMSIFSGQLPWNTLYFRWCKYYNTHSFFFIWGACFFVVCGYTILYQSTVVWSNQESRRKYCATRLSIHSSAHTNHSFACSALLTLLACSLRLFVRLLAHFAGLICLLARSLCCTHLFAHSLTSLHSFARLLTLLGSFIRSLPILWESV